MTNSSTAKHRKVFFPYSLQGAERPSLLKLINLLGVNQSSSDHLIESIPFAPGDATAGSENELQAAVNGDSQNVDLSIIISESNYFKNIIRKTQTGDSPQKVVDALHEYLNFDRDNIWENSWVRFKIDRLSSYAKKVFDRDLLSDKSKPGSAHRSDISQFKFTKNGVEHIRVPISYLLKLSLADAIGQPDVPSIIQDMAEQIMGHFINDNTSPETHSFYPINLTRDNNFGEALARETLVRYLLCEILIKYANKQFCLEETGQKAMIYQAPHPPVHQKQLNSIISDSFYRFLFMSPCLSGWDKGERKHQYMELCHRVLSISQLNAVRKLKEAGIITRNLIVLPNTSNICLANNGTHISLGSKRLTRLLKDPASGLQPDHEKYFGDLIIKVVEHFLPLFVGTYSADPYRLDFSDFHPERVLGFLPHELDFTHLRMIWRRWKKKAKLSFLGRSITPFGPEWLDNLMSKVFRLKGDYIIDFRLIDYLVALLSTQQSPSLNGKLNSEDCLKRDLATMGVFDTQMPLYLLYRLRAYNTIGFSGFEGRYYSLFESIHSDMGEAVNLQMLITALAYKYILTGQVTHRHIPDEPTIESERRQIFFGTAIGIPTFFVQKDTRNKFLLKILKHTKKTRPSNRYTGYTRVYNKKYQKALIEVIRKDAKDLIEMMALSQMVDRLENRISQPETFSASGRIAKGILNDLNISTPLKATGDFFNNAAERYYRTSLKQKHLEEALHVLQKDARDLDSWPNWRAGYYNHALFSLLNGQNTEDFLSLHKDAILNGHLSKATSEKLIGLILLTIDMNKKLNKEKIVL